MTGPFYQHKSNKIKIVFSVILIFIVILSVIPLIQENSNVVQNGVLNEEVVNKQHQRKLESNEQGGTAVYINTNIILKNKHDKARLLIQNSPYNTSPFYVELIDNSSGNILYKSDTINPGQYIKYDKLSNIDDNTEYECLAKFYINNSTTASVFVNVIVN